MIWIIIGAIASLVMTLLLTGVFYEIFSAQIMKRRHQDPIGDLIDVGDYKLHIQKMGERQADQPVVVLEASVGANSLDWQLVQPLIAEFAQVISYDRAGNGWSEKTSSDRTPDVLVEDLHKMLKNADVAPPYVLVGHRYGGMFVRKYQEKYPDDVAALVLVESSHPIVFDDDNRPEIKRLQRNANIFQRIGLVRLVTRRNYRLAYLDEAAKDQYLALMMQDNGNLLSEAQPILTNGIDLPDSIDLPLTVVSRAEDDDLKRERMLAERQRDLATLSENSTHVHTESGKRWIVFAHPQTVADAIKETFQAIVSN